MLWSGYDDFFCIAIAYSEQPCPSALADYCSRLAMEPAVGHTLLDAWFYNHMYPVTDLKTLNDGGNRRQSALSQFFLELIPCFLSWAVVMCHDLLSLLCSFNLHDIQTGDVSGSLQDLG